MEKGGEPRQKTRVGSLRLGGHIPGKTPQYSTDVAGRHDGIEYLAGSPDFDPNVVTLKGNRTAIERVKP